MELPLNIQLSQRGVLVLPKAIRDTYQLNAGDVLTLVDLGGVFVLTPQKPQVDQQADALAQDLYQSGESLESMLAAIRELRENPESAE